MNILFSLCSKVLMCMALPTCLHNEIRASRSRLWHLRLIWKTGFLQASTPVTLSIPHQYINIHYLQNKSPVRAHIHQAVSIVSSAITTFGSSSRLRCMTNLSERMHQPCKQERASLLSFEGSMQADNQPKSSKKGEKQPTRKQLLHLSQKKGPSGSGTKAKSLMKILMPLSNVREEVYRALDEWVAFEQDFPVVAVKRTLQRLKQKEQWQRIIQVSKWMLSKGQGQTLGTYGLMLKAYDMDARLEDAETLWEKLLNLHTRSMPKNMFIRMMSIYRRRKMPEKLLEVYNQMEKVGIKPDAGTLLRVGEVYIQLGMPKKQEELCREHPSISLCFNSKGKTVTAQARRPMKSQLLETVPMKVSKANVYVNLDDSAVTKVSQLPEADGMSRLNDNCRNGEKSKKEQLNIRRLDDEHNAGFLSETSLKRRSNQITWSMYKGILSSDTMWRFIWKQLLLACNLAKLRSCCTSRCCCFVGTVSARACCICKGLTPITEFLLYVEL